MRESQIEKTDRKRHAAEGRKLLKFVSPGLIGVPDNLLLTPVPQEHRELVAKYFRFVEYKQANQKPRASQERRIKELRDMGFVVDVVDRLQGD